MNAKKMAKHFELTVADGVFAYRRRFDQIAAEATLHGLYVPTRFSCTPGRCASAARPSTDDGKG